MLREVSECGILAAGSKIQKEIYEPRPEPLNDNNPALGPQCLTFGWIFRPHVQHENMSFRTPCKYALFTGCLHDGCIGLWLRYVRMIKLGGGEHGSAPWIYQKIQA